MSHDQEYDQQLLYYNGVTHNVLLIIFATHNYAVHISGQINILNVKYLQCFCELLPVFGPNEQTRMINLQYYLAKDD